jgi:hypothetical protein
MVIQQKAPDLPQNPARRFAGIGSQFSQHRKPHSALRIPLPLGSNEAQNLMKRDGARLDSSEL